MPTMQQLEAVRALKVGVATIADIEAAYGQPCAADGTVPTLQDHCFVVGKIGEPAGILLTYTMASDWSPSCFTDEVGCATVDQITYLSITYTFDASGIWRSVSSTSNCTAYVGEYVIDNGCIDHG